jgi:hypothetical protein
MPCIPCVNNYNKHGDGENSDVISNKSDVVGIMHRNGWINNIQEFLLASPYRLKHMKEGIYFNLHTQARIESHILRSKANGYL